MGSCWEFNTYSDCRFHNRCRRAHDIGRTYEQSFHVVKICSVEPRHGGYEMEVVDRTGENTTYYVPQGEYWSRNVTQGNLVIMQKSSARRARTNYGKICAILHESQGIDETLIPLEEDLRRGFTLVDNSRNLSKTLHAYSTNSCALHQGCKRIGVHIQATAIGKHCSKLKRNFVPFHKTNPRSQPSGFTADSIELAVSVYFHSASDQIEEPVLTSLFLRSEHFLDANDHDNCREYVEDMWRLFAKDSFIDDVSSTVACLKLVDSSSNWRPNLIARNSLNYFNQKITLFLQSKVGKFVVANHVRPKFGIPDGEIAVPGDVIDNIHRFPDSTAVEKQNVLAYLLASAKRTDKEFWRGYEDWYTFVATHCNELTDSHIVKTTSPIGQTSNYVNQQVLLAFMISPSIPLYSANEMIGIVVRRYETPTVLKAVLKKIRKDSIHLQLIGVHGRARGKRVISIEDIFGRECLESASLNYSPEDREASEGNDLRMLSFVMQKQTCEEYCNTKLVVLRGRELAALVDTVNEHGIDSSETVDSIREIVVEQNIVDTPYAAVEGGGTRVALRRGTELHLQLAIKSEFDEVERDTYLRLLRIGKDCHECLAHLNDPQRAFLLSNRRDVKDLISPDLADEIFENIRENRITKLVFKKKKITWNDDYFSGGRFISAGSGDIKQSNLLCIRREILSTNESEISFVWICHAVVSRVLNGEVTFLVCSLYQEQNPNIIFSDGTEFIVEVIDVSDVNADPCIPKST